MTHETERQVISVSVPAGHYNDRDSPLLTRVLEAVEPFDELPASWEVGCPSVDLNQELSERQGSAVVALDQVRHDLKLVRLDAVMLKGVGSIGQRGSGQDAVVGGKRGRFGGAAEGTMNTSQRAVRLEGRVKSEVPQTGNASTFCCNHHLGTATLLPQSSSPTHSIFKMSMKVWPFCLSRELRVYIGGLPLWLSFPARPYLKKWERGLRSSVISGPN